MVFGVKSIDHEGGSSERLGCIDHVRGTFNSSEIHCVFDFFLSPLGQVS